MILLRTSLAPTVPARRNGQSACPLTERRAGCPDALPPREASGEVEQNSFGQYGPAIAKNVPRARLRAYYAVLCLTACLGIAAAMMGPSSHAGPEARRSSSVEHQQRNHELAPKAAPRAAARHAAQWPPPAARETHGMVRLTAGSGRAQHGIGRARRSVGALARRTPGGQTRGPSSSRSRNQPRSDIARATLPNGIRVIIKSDPAAPVVAMRAVWTGGLRQELPEQSGITQLLATLFTRGCGGLGGDAVAAHAERLGGSLAGLAGRNSFGLRSEWPAQSWIAGMDLMARCIAAPNWPEAELAREKRRVADELARRATQPSTLAFRLFARTLYEHHPYGLDLLGTSETVAALTREALVQYYRDSFPASGMTLAIVGAVDPDDALRRVRQVFGSGGQERHGKDGGQEQHASQARHQPERSQTAPIVRPVRFGGRPARLREVYGYLQDPQAYVMIGFPGTTITHADRFALEVLAAMLGGPNGRIERELMRRQALAHRVGMMSVPGMDTGYVVAYLACTPHALGAAVAALRGELAQVARTAVDASELDRAKRALLASHERSLTQPAAVAAGLAFHEAHGLGHAEYLRYPAAISAVTAADVQRVAATYFDWEAAVTATVMPPAASPEAQKRAQGVKRRIPRGKRKRKP